MTFTLQPGDYIPTSEVPADKRQAVIDAFVAAGAKDKIRGDALAWNYDYVGWWIYVHDMHAALSATNKESVKGFKRRVTLEQILGEQIAKNANSFETRKPGGYVTKDQVEREAEHWQRVGPELLAAANWMHDFIHGLMDDPSRLDDSTQFQKVKEAITKARSIK